MKAFILAAGLGQRLRPFTDELPKALIEVEGTPMIKLLIEKLKNSGISEIVVNVHYKAGRLIEYLNVNDFGIPVSISDETQKLLDTGGAVRKASSFFNDDFLVHNTDVLSDINIKELVRQHKENNALATLAVRKRKSGRYLLFDENMTMAGWENLKSGERIIPFTQDQILKNLAFSGIHIINPRIFHYMPEKDVFSIIEVYLNICSREKIFGYLHDEDFWLDMGRLEDLEKARDYILNQMK